MVLEKVMNCLQPAGFPEQLPEDRTIRSILVRKTEKECSSLRPEHSFFILAILNPPDILQQDFCILISFSEPEEALEFFRRG